MTPTINVSLRCYPFWKPFLRLTMSGKLSHASSTERSPLLTTQSQRRFSTKFRRLTLKRRSALVPDLLKVRELLKTLLKPTVRRTEDGQLTLQKTMHFPQSQTVPRPPISKSRLYNRISKTPTSTTTNQIRNPNLPP